jgi:hypothetical protein
MSSIWARSSRLTSSQPIHPVKRHSTVVADDAAAPIGIWKTGDDSRPSAVHDFGSIGVEHAVIVRFAIFRESLVHGRIGIEIRQPSGLPRPYAGPRTGKIARLKGLIGLKTYDDLIVPIDKARLVRQKRRGRCCIDRKDSLLPLFAKYGCSFAQTAFVRCDGFVRKSSFPV